MNFFLALTIMERIEVDTTVETERGWCRRHLHHVAQKWASHKVGLHGPPVSFGLFVGLGIRDPSLCCRKLSRQSSVPQQTLVCSGRGWVGAVGRVVGRGGG